jgi:cell division FtsZ-interacting protein ZapD
VTTDRLTLIRDGTIVSGGGTEIDFRTPDYSVWLTIKADRDVDAEAVAAALEAAFGGQA